MQRYHCFKKCGREFVFDVVTMKIVESKDLITQSNMEEIIDKYTFDLWGINYCFDYMIDNGSRINEYEFDVLEKKMVLV